MVGVFADEPFEVVVEAQVGTASLGDIAMDDWSLGPQCNFYEGPWHGTTVSTSTVVTTSSGNRWSMSCRRK